MNSVNKLIGVLTLMMVMGYCAALGLEPRLNVDSAPGLLNNLIPNTIQQWTQSKRGAQQVSLFAVDENGQNPMADAYDDSLLRTYSDASGHQMMVAIAYDHVQREEDRVHRPEICYVAQGFTILTDDAATFVAGSKQGPAILGRRMLTRNGARYEAVSYWIRVGDSFTQNAWKSRAYVIQEGLVGRLHDGILVRVSEIIPGPAEAPLSFLRQEAFLGSLLQSISSPAARLIARRDSIALTP